MFGKNLQHYRLKRGITKSELAKQCGLTSMAISNYESGKRKPDNMEIIKRLAAALDVKVMDFLEPWRDGLSVEFAEFRKQHGCTVKSQEYVRSSVEEYLNRFYTIIDVLGEKVLPNPPVCHSLELLDNVDTNAHHLRQHLQFALIGSVGKLIEGLENLGIIVFEIEFSEHKKFSGMNGFVNGRPYIVLNKSMPSTVKRSTLAHELAHLMFNWSDFTGDVEETATAIGSAFLLSKKDAIRELGLHRNRVTRDMFSVCQEYGISSMLLVTRAKVCGIISGSSAKSFYIKANQLGWRDHDPIIIAEEVPTLFEQLVFRAVNLEEISITKGAELLKTTSEYVSTHCMFSAEG